MGSMKNIYLDNAAATPIDPRVMKEVARGMTIYGNPSSFNDIGRKSAKELTEARLKIARFLGAHSNEIIFTASGSESNNLAIWGRAHYRASTGKKILTTPIEHPSVLEPLKILSRKGFKTNFIKIDKEGTVDLADIENKLSGEIFLISVMYANNEIGTIEPIAKIGKLINEFRKKNKTAFPLFHVDACQAVGHLNLNVNHLNVDLLTFNGSKIYGPRGVGVLYVRNKINLESLIFGGGQEQGQRAGTENLPAILGLAKAISLIDKKESERLFKLRDCFIEKLKNILPEIKINGAVGRSRLPNNVNISIPKLDSENILLELDKHGIYAGSGSACTARSVEPSHVIKALAVDNKYVDGVIRLSLGRQTKKGDIDYVLEVLPRVIKTLKTRYGK